MARAVKRLNPALLDKDEARLLKPVTMSLFGVLNWTYLWFRDDGPISREDYARFATRLFVEGVARLTAEAGTRRTRGRKARRGGEASRRHCRTLRAVGMEPRVLVAADRIG